MILFYKSKYSVPKNTKGYRLKNYLKKYDFFRNLNGSYKIIKAWLKYFIKNDYPYKKIINEIGVKDNESFSDYFSKIEIERAKRKPKTHKIWKKNIGLNHVSIEKSEKDGKEWIEFLIQNGLKQSDTVLDYGCGSLRLGKSLIDYLDEGKYVGVDISDHFYNLGLKHYISSKLVSNKKPKFFIIDSNEYRKFMINRKFDFIYSSWVAMHVPPDMLDKYFENIFKLMNDNTKFYFDFIHSIITLRQNTLTWGYNSSKIKKIIQKNGFDTKRILGDFLEVTKKKY